MLAILTGALPNGFGIADVADPICPSRMPVVSGATYTCVVSINGETKNVPILVLDDAGKYQVSVPQ